MRPPRWRVIALAVLLGATPTHAQPTAPDTALLRRIFASGDFAAQSAGRTQWLDGDGYTVVERGAGGGTEIVRVDAGTGRREVLVPAAQLRAAGGAPLAVEGYAFSGDGRRVLIFTNSQRVWRENTRGDFWVLDRASGALRKLGGPDAKPSTLMFAKFSPDGERVAYVREGDLYVEPAGAAGGPVVRLTRDASRTVVNGTSDWVYEEEFDLRDGFRWSPDGKRIAYWQFDMAGVRDFLLVNETDSLYSYTTPIQYPKAGETNSAVRVGVVSAAGGPTTWVRLAGDPRDSYVPRMEWAGADELIVQHMDRRQQRDEVLLADASTGAARAVLVETDSAWVDVNDGPRFVDGGRRFLWVSERDGWRHVYSVSRDGKDVQLLTPGDYDVLSVVGVDSAAGALYVVASPGEPTRRALYRVSLRNPGPPVRVSPAGRGAHTYTVSPSGKWALHTFSTMDTPPVVDVVALPTHAVARTLATNDRLRAAVAPLVARPAELFRVAVAEGVELDGYLLRPAGFDSTRRYPVLVHVYGEPASQTVMDRWGGGQALWHRMLTDAGYVVMSVDPRGTPGPRGRAWRKVIYGNIGPLASDDIANAVRALTRARPYLDATRVAIWGWSGGGSGTLNGMFRHPDVFQVGMAVAPVPDQRLYDTIYQERYMGLPQEHPEWYRASSPINFAEGLRGKLLLVHGTGDDNVHFQGSARLANRLIALGKPFDFMAYPNRSHCICEGVGTTLHVYSLLTRYLTTNLPAGPR